MQPIAPGEGFECRSGCFSPEACINALQIRALDVAREGLSATIGDRSTVETIKLVNGNLALRLGQRILRLKMQRSTKRVVCIVSRKMV